MKKLILIVLCALGLVQSSFAADHLPLKRGTAATIPFCLRALNGFADVGETFAAGDVKVAIDGAAEANIATLPTVQGSCYRLSIAAGEILGKTTRFSIIKNASYFPKSIIIDTYGDAIALHNVPDTNVISYDTTLVGHTKTAVSASTTAITLAVGETYGDKSLNNNTSILIASSSNGIWQNACVCNYASATRIATFCVPLKIAPTGTVKYSVLPSQNCNMGLWPQSH